WQPSPPAANSWPPRTITGTAWVPLPVTAPSKCRVWWGSHSSPPGSPQGQPGSLACMLFLLEVHSPAHGYSVGVPRTLRILPGPQKHNHLQLGSGSHEEASWWPVCQSQHHAAILSSHLDQASGEARLIRVPPLLSLPFSSPSTR
ncbi:unnamed protein product, partial [Gulo gulo]